MEARKRVRISVSIRGATGPWLAEYEQDSHHLEQTQLLHLHEHILRG